MSTTKTRAQKATLTPAEQREQERDLERWTFVQALKRLAGVSRDPGGKEKIGKKNLGALAALRRGLGRPGGTAAEMYPYVVPYLPAGATRREEDDYFLIAALFAWHQMDWAPAEGEKTADTNFGASYRRLVEATSSESIERRFTALLNAHRADLPEHLRHAAGLLKSKAIPVNWTRLLRDLAHWDADDRRVQREWARSYWRAESARPPAPTDGAQSTQTL